MPPGKPSRKTASHRHVKASDSQMFSTPGVRSLRDFGCEYRTSRGGCKNIATQAVTYPRGTPAVKLCDDCYDMLRETMRRIHVDIERDVDVQPL